MTGWLAIFVATVFTVCYFAFEAVGRRDFAAATTHSFAAGAAAFTCWMVS